MPSATKFEYFEQIGILWKSDLIFWKLAWKLWQNFEAEGQKGQMSQEGEEENEASLKPSMQKAKTKKRRKVLCTQQSFFAQFSNHQAEFPINLYKYDLSL